MGSYQSVANIVLNLNGKQSHQVLTMLEKEAVKLQKAIEKASNAGDVKKVKSLQRELNQTNRLIEQMKGETAALEKTLARLDKATPRELNKALSTLQKQLTGIQRGTKQWDEHTAKIRAVKKELAKVNSELVTQKSLWNRMNGWLNNCQTALLGIVGALSGLIMAGRKAVNSYAQMEEQLANTVKYTGMARGEVDKLNDSFTKMNTRTPREKLNELAQEAGRLGKNTLESVQGYVEAADIINVALVDLGAGATQTIAKLTNIFGVEQMLGTKDAMLAVGSTVNVLSQNCTASKPYLVEFAQRMAGIGSQAGLTIPQILAFGAVLDANGQKVEMSATAIQKVIMNLANKNKEFAKTLGLDAEELNKTLKRSAKDGLMMFLQALHDLGEKSGYQNATMTLAPAFKDMGLDAARVSQVLSTLASHIGEVKDQMVNADKAFQEATSATNEYTIFNNTAQASIDKAKKHIQELAIELGEKLYPIMRHIYTSSSVFLRVLSSIVTFVINNSRAIIQLTAAIASYAIAVNAATIAYKLHHAWIVIVEKSTLLLKGAVVLARLAYYALTGQTTKCTAAFRLLHMTLKASPWGVITAAITALGFAIYNMATNTTAAEKATAEFGKKLKDAEKKANGFNDEMIKEQHELSVLFGRLEGATKGTSEYNSIKDKIIKQYGQYLGGLIDEKGEIINLTAAYNRLAKAIRRAAEEKGIADAKEEINKNYYSNMTESLDNLQSSLERYGADSKKAARLVQQVGSAISSGSAIPENVVKEINKYAANKPSGLGFKASVQYRAQNTKGFAGWVNQGLANILTLGGGAAEIPANPAELVNTMYTRKEQRDNSLSNIESMQDGVNPMRKVNDTELNWAIESLSAIVKSGKSGYALIHDAGNVFSNVLISVEDAKKKLAEYEDEAAIRRGGKRADQRDNLDDLDLDSTQYGEGFTSQKQLEKENKEAELAKNKAEREAKKILKEELKNEKKIKDEALAELEKLKASGEISNKEYDVRKDTINLDFIEAQKKVLDKKGLDDTAEYAELMKKKEELSNKIVEHIKKYEIEEIDKKYKEESDVVERAYKNGEKDYETYLTEKEVLDAKYLDDKIAVYKKHNLTENSDYASLLDERQKLLDSIHEREMEHLRKQEEERHKLAVQKIDMDYYTPGNDMFMNAGKRDKALFDEMIKYLETKRDTFLQGSKEWVNLDNQIQDEQNKRLKSKQEQYADMYNNMMRMDIIKSQFAERLALLDEVYHHEMELAEGNHERQMELLKAYKIARKVIMKEQKSEEKNESEKQKINSLVDWLETDGAKAVTGSLSTITSGMSDLFSEMNSLISTDLENQTSAIESRYDAELRAAEGNAYMVAELEKKKQKEIADAKNEANEKMFAMQIIQAVAQTATNALNAYGSAASVPTVGFILAPIAAAMAVAAGAIQIANIKKQQAAAASEGYAEGGFTPDGDKYQEVGVVHAGEWVASQKLTKSRVTRPILEALDLAQRNNTVGALNKSAVSMMMPGATSYQQAAVSPQIVVNKTAEDGSPSQLVIALDALNKRLNEPFVTVNTVTGDKGIKQAQDNYEKMIRNKSPKY